MSFVELDQNSRLIFSEFLSLMGVTFFDLIDFPIPSPQSDDTTYEWKSSDRIDLVADRFYGTPVLWYPIALANDIELVPTYINEGQRLRIPSPRYIQQVWLPAAKRLAREQR